MIVNPLAGAREASDELDRALKHLASMGWALNTRRTEERGDAEALARAAVRAGADIVVAAGGDGTINEAVNALAGTGVALGVLPLGTGNVWALEAGFLKRPFLKPDLMAASRALGEGRIRQVDLGRIGDRFFLLWAGVGLDAEILEEIEPEVKRRLGVLHYLEVGLRRGMNRPASEASFRIDGEELREETILAVVSNVSLYAAVAEIAPQARADDGLLDILILKGGRMAAAKQLAWLVGKGRIEDSLLVRRKARKIEIEASPPLPIQVDGDVAGATPATVEVAPGALRVLVAPGAEKGLFRRVEAGEGTL